LQRNLAGVDFNQMPVNTMPQPASGRRLGVVLRKLSPFGGYSVE
jgi:hypothetical protein